MTYYSCTNSSLTNHRLIMLCLIFTRATRGICGCTVVCWKTKMADLQWWRHMWTIYGQRHRTRFVIFITSIFSILVYFHHLHNKQICDKSGSIGHQSCKKVMKERKKMTIDAYHCVFSSMPENGLRSEVFLRSK